MRTFDYPLTEAHEKWDAAVQFLKGDPTTSAGEGAIHSTESPEGSSGGERYCSYPELILIVEGEAWVEEGDRQRHRLNPGQGAVWQTGEWCAYGPLTLRFRYLELTSSSLDSEWAVRHFQGGPGSPEIESLPPRSESARTSNGCSPMRNRVRFSLSISGESEAHPLETIPSLIKARRRVEDKMVELVRSARAMGHSWNEVADVLKISPEQARLRYSEDENTGAGEPPAS